MLITLILKTGRIITGKIIMENKRFYKLDTGKDEPETVSKLEIEHLDSLNSVLYKLMADMERTKGLL